jgi:hypothetical protein
MARPTRRAMPMNAMPFFTVWSAILIWVMLPGDDVGTIAREDGTVIVDETVLMLELP